MTGKQSGTLAYKIMRPLFAILALTAGIDKFFNVIKHWEILLSPLIPQFTHLEPEFVMHVIGVAEIVVGLAMIFLPRIGVFLSVCMYAGIMINLLTMRDQLHLASLNFTLMICCVALLTLTPSRCSGCSDHEAHQH